GETNIPTWSTSGSAAPMSRTCTWKAASTSAHAVPSIASTRSAGASASVFIVGGMRNHSSSTSSPASAMARSTSAAATYVAGRISRGKYTFVTSCAWETRLVVPLVDAVLKKVHASSPAYANTPYGTPSLGIRTSRVNTTVKIAINARGCSTAHAGPSSDCL